MIYIFGHKGQVGNLLKKQYPDAALYESRIQIEKNVRKFLKYLTSEDVVYLAASMTAVDECEKYPELSYQSNALGPKHIADVVVAAKATLVFYSSDYVFDGSAGPYSIWDMPNPINVYGKHKLCAENYIQQHVKKHHIIRTNLVFGPDENGRNFSSRLIETLRLGKNFITPSDEFVTPTYNKDLVKASISIVESRNYGIDHLTSGLFCSRVHLANLIAEGYGLDMDLIQPILSKDLSRVAPRPLECGLRPTHLCSGLVDSVIDMFSEGK